MGPDPKPVTRGPCLWGGVTTETRVPGEETLGVVVRLGRPLCYKNSVNSLYSYLD